MDCLHVMFRIAGLSLTFSAHCRTFPAGTVKIFSASPAAFEDRPQGRPEPRRNSVTVVSAADIGAWQVIAGRHFVPLHCTTPGPTFTATISPVLLAPDVSVCRIGSGPVRVERTDRLAQGNDGDDVLLSLQLSSSGTVSQHGRTARIVPGAAALYETNRPYVLDQPQPGQDLIVLRIGRERLGVRDRLIADVCGRTLDRQVPGMSAFAGYLRGM